MPAHFVRRKPSSRLIAPRSRSQPRKRQSAKASKASSPMTPQRGPRPSQGPGSLAVALAESSSAFSLAASRAASARSMGSCAPSWHSARRWPEQSLMQTRSMTRLLRGAAPPSAGDVKRKAETLIRVISQITAKSLGGTRKDLSRMYHSKGWKQPASAGATCSRLAVTARSSRKSAPSESLASVEAGACVEEAGVTTCGRSSSSFCCATTGFTGAPAAACAAGSDAGALKQT
mmetsp:Transcript_104900/g.296439  ORF Transcript_104900/g.296439 Transcript_104900/m.296439 type:complete len:232 (-) Transcript_104900:182-877(-)